MRLKIIVVLCVVALGSSCQTNHKPTGQPGPDTLHQVIDAKESTLEDAESPLDFASQLKHNMVLVKGGTFSMGVTEEGMETDPYLLNSWPLHEVKVKDFAICRYEVTNSEWQTVMDSLPSQTGGKPCMECPVAGVTWDEVQEFIDQLNASTESAYRLPSESEWEFAAQGGLKSQGYAFSGDNDPDSVAWYIGNYTDTRRSHPVGELKPNELGLYDMSGNVWEWCQDSWHENYQGAPIDGTAWNSSNEAYRVVRGGCWANPESSCTVTKRFGYAQDQTDVAFGFRLAHDATADR